MTRLLAAVALMLIIVGLSAIEVEKRWKAPLNLPPEGYTLTVAAGDSLRSVSTQWAADGVLAFPFILRAYGRWTGLDQQI